MSSSLYDLNSAVRQALARHWVDTQALHFVCTPGSVRFQGTLRRRGDAPGPPAMTLVDLLETETRRIPGVRRVFFHLCNWFKDDAGVWQERAPTRSSAPPLAGGAGAQTFELDVRTGATES